MGPTQPQQAEAPARRPASEVPLPEPGARPAIVFNHVTKRFGGAAHAAVDDVSFAIEPGEVVVLLGPSGCGKTTLLKMVNRLHEPDAGSIAVEGRDVHDFPVTQLRRQIGYVIQSAGLFPHMTVARNIATVPEMLGWSKQRIRGRVDELLDLVGLSPREYRDRYPAQLSGGQQQRIGLARALAADPHLMLMDEPFAAVDGITRRRLQDELLQIEERVRKTILFVTHDVDEAIRLAGRIAVMRAGRLVQYETPLRILSSPADEFVSTLVGADDGLRRLSLISVGSMMRRFPTAAGPARSPAITAETTLRQALAIMLATDAESVAVSDSSGRTVGEIDLHAISSAVRKAEA